MPWKRMLAYVTGEVEESLLLRIEYLIEQNRVLRNQLDRPSTPCSRGRSELPSSHPSMLLSEHVHQLLE